MKIPTLFATLLLCSGSFVAMANDTPADQSRLEQIFKNFDTNGDGSISLEEYRAGMVGNMAPGRIESVFKEKDRNGDGKLNMEELAYVPMDQRPAKPSDKSSPKKDALPPAVKTPAPVARDTPADQSRLEQMFKNFDTNGDGSISLEEYRAGMVGNMAPGRIESVFKEKDRNGDGKLNMEELAYVPMDQRPAKPSDKSPSKTDDKKSQNH